jgi:hypothetical protein
MGFVYPVHGGELLYKDIALAPPPGFTAPIIGCRPGFGQPWFDAAQGPKMSLGYYEGQLIGQAYWLKLERGKEDASWSDLKIVQGAPLTWVAFSHFREGGREDKTPAYEVVFYFVPSETVKKVCFPFKN